MSKCCTPESKPEVTVNIKFRDVTLRGLTVQEVHALWNALAELLDVPQEIEEEFQLPTPPSWPYPWTTTDDKFTTYGSYRGGSLGNGTFTRGPSAGLSFVVVPFGDFAVDGAGIPYFDEDYCS